MVTNGTRSGGTPQAGTSAAHKTRTNGGPVVTQGQNYYSHSREEVTRILIQALNDLGYNAAADIVGQESGYRVETPEVVAFRQAVLEGSWSRAEELLCGKTVRGSGPASGSGLGLAPGADRNLMRFWLRQQKFLELLERRETARALGVLRGELTPLCADQHHTLHLLSRLLMCQDADDLKSKANWDGVNGKSRQKLLDQLSQLLADLLTPGAESSKKQIEVWQVCFSPDGKWLASCGSGDSVCIWDVQHLSIRQQLNGPHKGGVGNIAWSPDSRLLISCGIDRVARIWDTDLGECVVTIDGFLEPVSSCVWAADGQSVIIGSFDKTQPLSQWDLAGNLVHMWADTYRTGGVGLSTDQRWLVAMDDQRTLHLYNFLTREHVYDMPLTDRPTSVSISHDSRHILVNKADHEALLIDIEAREIVQKYMGQIGGRVHD
ncbi:hypothetical protein N0V88_002362 [Collariella sp. IMI 366227]|nr:hypothetical protein N0V88_002362 [Collariella sp. IMI 366227]